MKLPLDTIKQMFNLPPTATTMDVIKIANDNNITIDFSNTNNNDTQNTNLNNPSGSIYGDNSSQPAAPKPASTPSAQTSTKTNFNIDLTNPMSSSNLGGSTSNNNSVFGFGNTNQPEDDFMGFKRTTSPALSQNLTVSGQVTDKRKPESDSTLRTYSSSSSTGKLDDFLSSAFSSTDTKFAKFSKMSMDADNEKVIKITFTPDGKKQKIFEDGSTKIEDLSPEELEFRSKVSEDNRIVSIEYQNGNTIMKNANGETIQDRPARFGEYGYKKDGNSIDEDLASVLGEDKVKTAQEAEVKAKTRISEIDAQLTECSDEKIEELKQTDPKQAKELEKQQKKLKKEKAKLEKKINDGKKDLASAYIKKIYKECGGDKDKIKAKIDSLVRNSDMTSETAQQMVHILGRFHEKYGNLSQDEMAEVLASAMDPANENSAEITDAMADVATRERGKTGKTMRGAFAQAAQQTGNEEVAAQALARHIGNAVDPDTDEVDVEAAQDIGRTAIALGGKDGAMAVADQLQQEDNDDLKVAGNKPIDEYAAQTGDEEVMQASIDVITSIEDAEKQVKANEQTHQTYEEMGASDEVKQARARIVGQNLYNFHEDARTQIDNYERQNDINNTYSNAAREAKVQYEAEQKAKAAEENTNSNVTSESKETNTSEHLTSSIAESARRINGIVNNNALNATQKAKQIRTLNPKEQTAAIAQVIKTATLPEIKSLALSGFKTEIVKYLLDNYSSENQSTLDNLKPLMNDAEINRYQDLMQQYKSRDFQIQPQQKHNFFIS